MATRSFIPYVVIPMTIFGIRLDIKFGISVQFSSVMVYCRK